MREATLRFLREMGVTTVFGNPGSTELPMFRGWPSDFRYVLGLNETCAVAMADGFACVTGNAGVVNLHSSAGVGHGLGNIFTAYRNHSPLVIIAGQQARALLPLDPFLGAEQPAEFPRPFVKWAVEPARAADVPLAIARAYHVAMQAPRGPTLVSVPMDDWDAPAAPFEARPRIAPPAPDAAAIAAALDALLGAKKPVFIAGSEVDEAQAWDAMVALAERFGAPVWEAPRSHRASFPETHPLFAGFLGPRRDLVSKPLQGHDLVLVAGAPAFTYHADAVGAFLPPGAELIQLTCDPHVAARSPEGYAIVGDVGAALRALLIGAPPPRKLGAALRKTADVKGREPIPVEFLMQTLQRVRPRDSLIVEEAPSSRPAMQAHLPIERQGGFLTTASGGLGYGLPAAVGASLADPTRRTIAVIGDGSALYVIQALWTAVQHALPLTIVIVNNQAYEALMIFGVMLQTPPVGVDLPGLDFCALARGQGCEAVRVTQPEKLENALKTALKSKGPMLVDVAVGPSGGGW
ncbi:MAG: benzoylformate decarboxylase [Hyphomonadaceae bacterium]|nr:benzoylformate decarboxylase [Hyphomonadaceae bacterium]